jgi:acyl carrier protein
MIEAQIEAMIAAAAADRNSSYTPRSRLIADLGMDSFDLVRLIIDIEAALDIELDEATQAFFAEGSVREICARVAQFGRVSVASP